MTRRERRAQAANGSTTKLKSADDIPHSLPPTNPHKPAKTLFELAEERRAQLQPGVQPFSLSSNSKNVVNVKIKEDGSVEHLPNAPTSTSNNEPLTPLWDTLFFSTSLSALHFTLATLTMHQYAQALEFPSLITNTLFLALPTLTLLIHLFHGHLLPRPLLSLYDTASETTQALLYALRQLFLLVVANVSGAYLIYLCNDRGYYAVMKNAPSIGTVWVWCILELGLLGAVLGVIGPAAWARVKGYTIF